MNPAECETHYLAIAGNLDFYGMDRHAVKVSMSWVFKICLRLSCPAQVPLREKNPEYDPVYSRIRCSYAYIWK